MSVLLNTMVSQALDKGCEGDAVKDDATVTPSDAKCTCSGMEFLWNRWVFTGRCTCKTK